MSSAALKVSKTPWELEGLSVLKEIGRGSSSIVYHAHRNGESFALKVLQEKDGKYSDTQKQAFFREASILARINHENLVQIFKVSSPEIEPPFLVMEYVQNYSLGELLLKGKLEESHALRIIRQIASGLSAVHRYGLIHRDLKPANIMLDQENKVKIIDFGLATHKKSEASDEAVGTFFYSAPEQTGMLHREVDARSDLYSLGAIFYQCLTGRLPFESNDLAELLRLHLSAAPPDLKSLRPEISDFTQRIVDKILAKDPDDRYQSVHSLLHDIDHHVELQTNFNQSHQASIGKHANKVQKSSDLPLAGRKNEEAQLEKILQSVLKREGQAVVICGDPGGGKSRLAREMLYHADAMSETRILSAKASMSGGVPYGPIRNAIDSFLANIETSAEHDKIRKTVIDALGPAAPFIKSFSPEVEKILIDVGDARDVASEEKYNRALVDLIMALEDENRILILLIDDLQWLDSSSLQILKLLSARIKRSRFLILASMRQNNEAPVDCYSIFSDNVKNRVSVISLESFDKISTKEMISDYLGTTNVEDKVVTQIYSRSSGNPFAIQQFLISLLDSGNLMIDWGKWIYLEQGLAALDLPSDVTQLLVARTRSLSPNSKLILEYAALIDDEFSTDILVEVSRVKDADVHEAMSEALEFHLIESTKEGYHRFLHDRIRESLVSAWPKESLSSTHQRIAESIERTYQNDRALIFSIARHYSLGTYLAQPNKMFATNFEAAQAAFQAHAVKDAVIYFESALRAVEVDSALLTSDFEEQCSECYFRLGRINDAFVHLEKANELASNKLQRARILGKLSLLYMTKGDRVNSWKFVNSSFKELGVRPLEKNIFVLFEAIKNLCISLFIDKFFKVLKPTKDPFQQERLKILVEISSRAIHMAFYDSRNDLTILANFRYSLWARQLGISKELVKSDVNMGLFFASIHRMKLQEKFFERAIYNSRQLGDPALIAFSQIQQANAWKFAGIDLDAEKKFREILIPASRWSDPEQATSGFSAFCQILMRKGFFSEALFWAEKAEAISDAPALKTEFQSYKCAIYASQGKHEAALASLKSVERHLEHFASNSLKGLHLFNYGIYLFELGEVGENVDALLDEYENSKIYIKNAPPFVRSLLVPGAYLRLNQWIKATTENKPKRKEKLLFAIEILRNYGCSGSVRVKIEDVLQAHVSALEGTVAVYENRFLEATRHFDLAENLSFKTDCHWSLFYVYRGRASMLYQQGHLKPAEHSHRLAIALATNQGWAMRLENLRNDFPALTELGRIDSTNYATLTQRSSTENVQQMNLQHQLDALLELGAATSKAFGLEAHCYLVLKQITKLLNPERAFLFLFEIDSDKVTMQLGMNNDGSIIEDQNILRYSKTIVEKVRIEQRPMVSTKSDSGEQLNSQSVVAYNLRSVMAVPLLLQGKLMGVIYLDSRVAKGIFNEAHVQLLMTFGSHIAIALENAKSTQLEIIKKTLEKDIEVVGAVQSLLLPKISSLSTEHLEVCSSFTPAQQAGGDWWWMSETEDKKLRILLADVTGHGAGSAMVTALVAGGYQTAERLLDKAPIVQLLDNLNQLILASCGQEYWMTFTVVEIDPAAKKFEAWYMSSPEIYVSTPTESKLVGSTSGSSPIGSGELSYSHRAENFNPGDQMILFTDGLYEFQTKSGDEFTVRHLKRLFDKTNKIEKIEDQVIRITSLRSEQSNSKTLEDDVTYIVVKFKQP